MQYSVLPSYFTKLFAESGSYNVIPSASQIAITPGAASLTDGFPPLTRTPLAAGGVPPSGEDINGILRWLSQVAQRFQAGGIMPYNSAFATAIGGYPKGALVRKADGTGYWKCTADSNTTDPDGASPANWAEIGVMLAGNQTISGVKTFSSSPIVPAGDADGEPVHFGQFGASLSGNGYQKLPNGWIIQWGTQAFGDNTTLTVTLPIAFQSAILAVFGCVADAISTTRDGASNSAGKNGTSLSTIRVTTDEGFGTVYFAIGY